MSEYKHFLITIGFNSIYDTDLMEKYQDITNNEYEEIDDIMMSLIRECKNKEFKLYHVKEKYIPYITVEKHFAYEMINFDKYRYKLDLIKKILSSETDQNNTVMIIESIIFSDIKSPILTDQEYLELIKTP